MDFTIEPQIGASPILLGMKQARVAEILGKPQRRGSTWLGDAEEVFEGCLVRYRSGLVSEVSIYVPSKALLGDVDLLSAGKALEALLGVDEEPYESVGFLIFKTAGIAVTGLIDDEQRVVTVFAVGVFDRVLSRAKRWSSQAPR